jgi:HEAT repeats
MNIRLLLIAPLLTLALHALPALSASMAMAAAESADPKEEALYADGTRAINESRWSEAEAIFARLAGQRGSRAEGAIYWKAYAENKEGQSSKAISSCAALRHGFPQSHWIEDCGALEIEIRDHSGQPAPPLAEQDDELKLLALNSLMQHDEAHALPAIRQILNSDHPERLKERALFVLAQSQSKEAQDLFAQIARGQSNPALQVKAIQMWAAFRGQQSADSLAGIYEQSHDDRVKKAVLQAYLISGNPGRLLEAARHESDPELARTAVHLLGALGAVPDLITLYHETNSVEVKSSILDGFIPAGSKGSDALAGIATSEKNPELRRKAIRNLGVAGGAAVAPALVATYQNNADVETKRAALQGLFLTGDAHDLVALARAEKNPSLKTAIVQQLSLMQSKEATDYMLEILNK